MDPLAITVYRYLHSSLNYRGSLSRGVLNWNRDRAKYITVLKTVRALQNYATRNQTEGNPISKDRFNNEQQSFKDTLTYRVTLNV